MLLGTDALVSTQDDDLVATPCHDENTFVVRLDSRQLRQVAQREICRLDKSILTPVPTSLHLRQRGYETSID